MLLWCVSQSCMAAMSDARANSARQLLESLFRAAVAAAHPSGCLPPNLPDPPARGRLVILAAGKAAGSMIEVAEAHYAGTLPRERLAGLGVTRHGYGRPTRNIPVIEAGHPVPDKAGISATKRTLALVDAVDGDDLVLVLLSGGASANWIAPAQGLTLEEKQATTRALLRSGAAIGEMNAVRKHLSRIKGGRLAQRAHPARVVTLAISDVPGDDPAVIGSGPTVPDPTTLAGARDIVRRHGLALPEAVTLALSDPANETPKPGDAVFAHNDYRIVARPADALRAAAQVAQAAGYEPIILGDTLRGRGPRSRPRARAACSRHCRARPPSRDPFGRRADGHATRQRPRRPESGIRSRSCRKPGRGSASLWSRSGHGWNRWRRRAKRRSRRRVRRSGHAQSGTCGRPRCRRVSRRQRFYRILQWHRRPVSSGSDVHQRHRLPRHSY